MQRRHLIAVLIAPLLVSATQAEDGKHLFILSGQSNMVGLSPKVSFTPAVEKEFGKHNVIVIKSAESGQPIRRWYKDWKSKAGEPLSTTNGDLYDEMMSLVNPAIEGQKIASVTFVWMQGECDAKESHGEVYGASFMGIIKQLEKDLKREDINFVIGRLGSGQLGGDRFPHWAMVRDAQVKVAEDSARGAWIDTDDCPLKADKVHYTPEGYKIIGQRFAEKAIGLIRK